MIYDGTMLPCSYMMIDDIISLVDFLIINQLQNLLMPKIFWRWPSNQGSY
jgi:hypothetical protein